MDPEDLTLLELDPTPVTDVFDLMALQLTKKIQALKASASHVHQLNRVSAHYLALALFEVIEVAQDLHTFLLALADSD